MGVAYLMHTVTPSSSLEPSISLASVPCGFSSIALGCCLSTLLHVKTVLYLFIEIISRTVEKFAKFKTRKNLVLYMVWYHALWHHSMITPSCTSTQYNIPSVSSITNCDLGNSSGSGLIPGEFKAILYIVL